MQAASEHNVLGPADSQIGSLGSIVADMMSLMGHVQASIALIEAAVGRESGARNHDDFTDVVVLDDVTPRYARATAALNACNIGLGAALHSLLDICEPVAEPPPGGSHKSA